MINRMGNMDDCANLSAPVAPKKFIVTVTMPMEESEDEAFMYSFDVEAISIDHITRMLNQNGLPYVVETLIE